jgi:tetratricopeptide (TPR) repeat protein
LRVSLKWSSAALIAIAVLLAWSNSLRAPFELDDHESIVGNASLRHLWSLQWLTPPATGGETVSGRPVLNLSFALNYALGGLEVAGYRALNVFIHLLSGLTLFGIVRRTLARMPPAAGAARDAGADRGGGVGLALAAALIWSVHPLQTAAVTYVAQRAESLAGLFYLLILYCFIRAVERGAATVGWSIASVGACLLGMATKETVATAPLIVLLYDRAFVSGSLGATWRAHGRLHAALAATWLPLAALVLTNRGRGGSAGLGAAIDPWTYLLTQGEAIPRYLALAFWPGAQVFDYGMPTAAGLHAVWPQLLVLGLLAAAAAWALWRNRTAGFLGAVFFLILAPSSSLVPVATQTIAEHRMYLPLAALVVLVCLAVRGGLRRRGGWWFAGALTAVVVVALGTATFARNRVYRSGLALWQDTVAKRPENARAHNNLGLALSAAGRADEAMAEYRRAIALQPNHAFAHFNLATTLSAQGRLEEAVAHFRAALAADAGYVSARVNLGQALARLGRTEEAMAQYQAALATDPAAQDARTNLAALLIEQGHPEEAVAMLHDVLTAAPGLAEAHYHLGMALEKSGGDSAVAEAAFREAVRLKPELAAAHLALGNDLARRGDEPGAESAYREAMRLDAGSAEARFALGNVFAKQRNFEAAMNAYRAALALDPTHVQARSNLGNCQVMTGRWREAIATYEDALRLRPGDETVQKNLALARELLRTGTPEAP